MGEPKLTLYQKLAKIRKPVEVLSKNRSGYNYKYVSDDVILSKLTGLMDKYGVSLIPMVVPSTTEITPYTYTTVKVDKSKNRIETVNNDVLVKADLVYRWVDDETGEFIEVPWTLVGQQSNVSMAFGSGMTYCRRYFLLHYFAVSTVEDDPDAWRSRQAKAEIEETLSRIHVLVTSYLALNPGKRAEISEIIHKYAGDVGGKPNYNYNSITNGAVADKLLEELIEYTSASEATDKVNLEE